MTLLVIIHIRSLFTAIPIQAIAHITQDTPLQDIADMTTAITVGIRPDITTGGAPPGKSG
jgi:hypothetical protein